MPKILTVVYTKEDVLQMKSVLVNSLGMGLILVGASSFCFGTAIGPEIDGAGAANALALLAGVMLVIRGRKR
jgi:hypothetical protein